MPTSSSSSRVREDVQLAGAQGLKGHAALYLFLASIAVVTFIFRDAGDSMLQSWSQEEYSHGYLIPPLAILLLVNRMSDLRIVPRSSWIGVVVVALCLASAFIFEFAGIFHVLPQIYVFCLIGTILLFFGMGALHPLAGPLILLLFATPLPKTVYYAISTQMQMASTTLGVTLLDWLGVAVFQEGNIIDLGGYKLNVVEACSGVRYLFPLLSLSFLLSYMFKAPFWKRAVVFLSTIPLSILLNGLRLLVIGVTVDQWGAAMAEGLIHDTEGFVVFLLGLCGLLLEIRVLRSFLGGGELQFDGLRIPSLRSFPLLVAGRSSMVGAVILLAGGIFSAFLPTILDHYLQTVPLRQPFSQFPVQIGPWTGQFEVLSQGELQVLGTNDYLVADYAQYGGRPVNLYVLYYSKQDSSSNQAVHTPTVCIPGGGWEVEGATTKTIPVVDPSSPKSQFLDVNRLTISKDGARELVYYWYAQDTGSETSQKATRLSTLASSLFRGRSNGGMVRVVTAIAPGETEEMAEARINAFLKDGFNTLYDFMFAK